MITWSGIVALLVLTAIFLIIYSKVKGETLREAFDELIELVTGGHG